MKTTTRPRAAPPTEPMVATLTPRPMHPNEDDADRAHACGVEDAARHLFAPDDWTEDA